MKLKSVFCLLDVYFFPQQIQGQVYRHEVDTQFSYFDS